MIEYHFTFPEKKQITFEVNRKRKYTKKLDQENHPSWTELSSCQCKNCPLEEKDYRHCPAAVDLQQIITEFAEVPSVKRVLVEVKTPERRFAQECDLQTGLHSLLGLVMATSSCPILSRLSSLANFHLPFATMAETIYRTVGNYLIKQFLVKKSGGIPDFNLRGLENLYQELELVNLGLSKRIAQVSKKDANINAIIRFFALSQIIRLSISDRFKNYRDSF